MPKVTVQDTGTAIARTGTLKASTGARAGVTPASSARASRAHATGGISGIVNNSAGGATRARSTTTPPAPAGALPNEDGTLLDRLWTAPRVLAAIAQRGLNPDWERANFERKPQGQNPNNWTVEYLVAWLLRSTVLVPDPMPTPIHRVAIDRVPPRLDQRVAAACASSAYAHDPWQGDARRSPKPIWPAEVCCERKER